MAERKQVITQLNTGASFPLLGLGTWQSPKGEVSKAVKVALESGYRTIDAAWIYGNEQEVGEGIAAFLKENPSVKREELFIVSKLWNEMHRPAAVEKAIDESLKNLQLDYLDLYLIHWPVALQKGPDGKTQSDTGVTHKETWQAMEKVYQSGRAKAIGVSNFNVRQLKSLLEYAQVKPAVNQVELHPYLVQPELTAFCKEHGIVLMAYSPFGGSTDRPRAKPDEPRLMNDPVVGEIAKVHGVSPSAVLIRFHLDRGVVAIPKSTNADRIRENLRSLDFSLNADELAKLLLLNRNYRFIDFFEDYPEYPFRD